MSSTPRETTAHPSLEVSSVSVDYDGLEAVKDVSFSIRQGSITAIIGPNGCGKSSLLRSIVGLEPLAAGSVKVAGEDFAKLPRKKAALKLGFLPQIPVIPEGILVSELVERGRHPHRSFVQQWAAKDDDIVREALAHTGCADLYDRPVSDLSGGQRQRVWIALVLAQQTPLMLLDEPTTYLDMSHSIDILNVVEDMRQHRDATVLMVLHDFNLAARFCDELIVMKDGQFICQGPPEKVLTQELLRDVFQLDATVMNDPHDGVPLVAPTGKSLSS